MISLCAYFFEQEQGSSNVLSDSAKRAEDIARNRSDVFNAAKKTADMARNAANVVRDKANAYRESNVGKFLHGGLGEKTYDATKREEKRRAYDFLKKEQEDKRREHDFQDAKQNYKTTMLNRNNEDAGLRIGKFLDKNNEGGNSLSGSGAKILNKAANYYSH